MRSSLSALLMIACGTQVAFGQAAPAERPAPGFEQLEAEMGAANAAPGPRTVPAKVVPVPDTAKAAADAMAFELGVPSVEGLMRNRYVGRTFIEGTADRASKVRAKYTPLPEVLSGKRVLLVEDSIVRSTTMRALVGEILERGFLIGALELVEEGEHRVRRFGHAAFEHVIRVVAVAEQVGALVAQLHDLEDIAAVVELAGGSAAREGAPRGDAHRPARARRRLRPVRARAAGRAGRAFGTLCATGRRREERRGQ